MNDSDNTKIIEPLAKFHARVLSKNRITLPKETRDFYKISELDYVLVILRVRTDPYTQPIGRVLLALRVSTNGVVSIPQEVVSKFDIHRGDILEILLLRVIHTPRIKIVAEDIPITIPAELKRKGYILLDETGEARLLQRLYDYLYK